LVIHGSEKMVSICIKVRRNSVVSVCFCKIIISFLDYMSYVKKINSPIVILLVASGDDKKEV